MDALTLSIENENFVGVLSALESQLLLELLVSVGSEHHINSLLLARLQSAVVRPDLEPFAIVILAVTLSCGHS